MLTEWWQRPWLEVTHSFPLHVPSKTLYLLRHAPARTTAKRNQDQLQAWQPARKTSESARRFHKDMTFERPTDSLTIPTQSPISLTLRDASIHNKTNIFLTLSLKTPLIFGKKIMLQKTRHTRFDRAYNPAGTLRLRLLSQTCPV